MIEALAGNGAALKNVQNATELLIFKNTTKHADDVVRLISEKGDDFVRVYSQFGDPAVDVLVRCGSDAIGEIDTYGVRFFGLIDTYGDDFVSLYEKYGSTAVEQCLNHGDEVIELVGKYGDDCADLVMRYGDDVLEGITKHGDEFLERYAKEGDEFIEEYLEKGDGVFESGSYTIKAGNSNGYNPLENIIYTDKVKEQMMLGDYHSFPEAVEGFGDMGKVSQIIGGDGVTRTLVEIEGSYKGKSGVFQFILEPDGVTCNHRLFVPE